MNKAGERLINGLVKENPTFVLMLGMCPTLAVTTSAINGLGMGLTTMVVLALSNVIISLLRNIIPDKVRIPAFIVIIASFVTMVELLLQAYIPFLYDSLGIYIPLIVVNCIILGRAEAYASKNPVIPSFFDGVGMGLGFSFALTCIGAVREILGSGKVFDIQIMPDSFEPIGIFVLAPGAFFVLAALTALQNVLKASREKAGKDASKIQSGCSEDCMNCKDSGCSKRFYDTEAGKTVEMEKVETTTKPEIKAEKTEAEVVTNEGTEVKDEVVDEVKADEVENAEEVVEKEVEEKPKKTSTAKRTTTAKKTTTATKKTTSTTKKTTTTKKPTATKSSSTTKAQSKTAKDEPKVVNEEADADIVFIDLDGKEDN